MADLIGWILLLIIFIWIYIVTKRHTQIKNFLLVAYFVRFLCVLINRYEILILPDSQFDAKTFELIARDFSREYGLLIIFDFLRTDSLLISRIISLFYTIFGESKIIAQSISVALGTVSVYLVYYLCNIIWDQKSAIKAAWFTALFPTLILYSSLTFRETYIVFFLLLGLISIVKFIKNKNIFSFTLVLLSFYILIFFHGAAALGGFIFLFYLILNLAKKQLINLYNLKINLFPFLFIIASLVPIILLLTGNIKIPYLPSLLDLESIIFKANAGINDIAAYPSWLIINNYYELFYKVIIKFFYFLYSPFIWDLKTPYHIVGLFDGTLYLILTFYVIKNWYSIRSNPYTYFFLILFVFYITIHALGVGNFGTGIRHRSKFVVLLIILAAPKMHKFIFSGNKKLYKK